MINAFPEIEEDWDHGERIERHKPGMELRDYFAAKAMQGLCAGVHWIDDNNAGHAKTAYEIADAMLAARETKEAK